MVFGIISWNFEVQTYFFTIFSKLTFTRIHDFEHFFNSKNTIRLICEHTRTVIKYDLIVFKTDDNNLQTKLFKFLIYKTPPHKNNTYSLNFPKLTRCPLVVKRNNQNEKNHLPNINHKILNRKLQF